MEKFRLTPIKTNNSYSILWNNLPDEVIDNLLPHYYRNHRSINEDGNVELKTFVNIEPVKKFRKKETIVKLSEEIELGLDD